MKKFVALVVVLCAVMISSTVSANNYFSTINNQTLCMTTRNLYREIESEQAEKGYDYEPKNESKYNQLIPYSEFVTKAEKESAERAEQERLREEESRRNEFYQLIFAVTLAIGIIAIFLRYQYNKNRQISFMACFSSFANQKNFWALIFCVVSLVMCLFYVPYNLVKPSNPEIVFKTAHATIFEVPEDFNPRVTKIDYQSIAFREFLILIGCCAGYAVSTVMKKK